MLRERACYAACCLALSMIGCGARTGLDVPPPEPCALDEAIPAIAPCEAFELGEAVMLSESLGPGRRGSYVFSHDARPHLGGAAVVYEMERRPPEDPRGDYEVRALALDVEARAPMAPHVILSRPATSRSAVPPSVSGGCELHALTFLETVDPPSKTARLAIAGEHHLELVELGPVYTWDVRRAGEVLSWLELHFDGGGLQRVLADRRGRIVRRAAIERIGSFRPGEVAHHVLAERSFVMPFELEGPAGPFTELAHYDEGGALLASRPFTEARVHHTALVWRDGERWLFWQERASSADDHHNLHAAPLADDGTLGPALALELGARVGTSRFTPAWIGDHWLIPVLDPETDTSYLGVFDEAGDQQALFPLGGGVAHTNIVPHTAHVVPTPAGAIVTYDEVHIGDRGAVYDIFLFARTVRCAAR